MKSLTLSSRPAPRKLLSGLALAVLCLASAGAVQAALSYEEAVAREPKTNLPLYREQHLVRREGGTVVERLVIYRCLDGTAFARKQLDYRRSTQAPEFALEDARLGYAEGLRRAGGGVSLFVRERVQGPELKAPLDAPTSALVVASGFA
jgi:hypothetical protein